MLNVALPERRSDGALCDAGGGDTVLALDDLKLPEYDFKPLAETCLEAVLRRFDGAGGSGVTALRSSLLTGFVLSLH